MSFHGLTVQELEFRAEVREFLARELTPQMVRATDNNRSLFLAPHVTLPWQRKLLERRWLAPHWPREYGGSGWTALQYFIFESEAGRAGAPLLAPFGLKYLGPVLIRFGSEAQRQYFLPRILSGEDYWCQGYSEPNAGSDLAGLQCTARLEGAEYVVNGTKLWTTHAHYANWIFCLVRSRTGERPQDGISFVLVDLRSPGVTVSPILSFTGEHEVNQIFFDSVRVPASQLVGREGEGWNIARYLLEFERGTFIMSGLLARKLERCKALAAQISTTEEGRTLLAQLAHIEIDLLALEAAELRCAVDLEAGRTPGAESSLIKVEFSELLQRIEAATLVALGGAGLAFSTEEGSAVAGGLAAADGPVMAEGRPAAAGEPSEAGALVGAYLNNRAATIYGGSNEIQRELIAKHLVGL
jgi:acyl-CoA dehydrogenase